MNEILNYARKNPWKMALIFAAFLCWAVSIRWIVIDNTPPAWDSGHYLVQATSLYKAFVDDGVSSFVHAVFNHDRGRVPLNALIVQPFFFFVGPSFAAAVFVLNFFWFLMAWSIAGLSSQLSGDGKEGDRVGFFGFLLFSLWPMTMILSHNFMVEILLVSFSTVSIYGLYMLYSFGGRKWAVISGVAVGLGCLTKVTFPAFFLPGLIYLIFRSLRNSSLRLTFKKFRLAALIAFFIAGPYYIYNLAPLLDMTKVLSSKEIGKLYGFNYFWEPPAIERFLREVFHNPPMLLVAIALLLVFVERFRKKSDPDIKQIDLNKDLIAVMALWIAIPLLLTVFGQVKEQRYFYPSVAAVCIFGGLLVQRMTRKALGRTVVWLLLIFPMSEFMARNAFISVANANSVLKIVGMNWLTEGGDTVPNGQSWKLKELVSEINERLGASQAYKQVLFLGGNLYYHLSLFEFEGLMINSKLRYFTLPYYQNSGMTDTEAALFVQDKGPAGILYKTGENWPEFSSRLDAALIAKIEQEALYEKKDLGIVQPDGSRFFLFVPKRKD